jgi:serine/threonine protein kinase
MEACEMDLFTALEQFRDGALELPDSWRPLRVALDVARGIEYLDSRGVIHCDLKSLNVMLDRHYRGKLIDFGDALRGTRRLHQLDVFRGTPAWSAPEVLASEKIVTHKSDVYSFGIVLWELLSFEPPSVCFEVDSLSLSRSRKKGHRKNKSSKSNPLHTPLMAGGAEEPMTKVRKRAYITTNELAVKHTRQAGRRPDIPDFSTEPEVTVVLPAQRPPPPPRARLKARAPRPSRESAAVAAAVGAPSPRVPTLAARRRSTFPCLSFPFLSVFRLI